MAMLQDRTKHRLKIDFIFTSKQNLLAPVLLSESAPACWRCFCLYSWRKIINLSRGTSTSLITVSSCRRSIQLYKVGVFTGSINSTPIASRYTLWTPKVAMMMMSKSPTSSFSLMILFGKCFLSPSSRMLNLSLASSTDFA